MTLNKTFSKDLFKNMFFTDLLNGPFLNTLWLGPLRAHNLQLPPAADVHLTAANVRLDAKEP